MAEAGKKRKANDEDTKVDNNQTAAEDMLKRKGTTFMGTNYLRVESLAILLVLVQDQVEESR